MTRIIVRPRAQADIDAALGWYHQRGPDLTQLLLAEIDVTFERICENPRQFPIVADPVQRRSFASSHTASISLCPVTSRQLLPSFIKAGSPSIGNHAAARQANSGLQQTKTSLRSAFAAEA